MIRRFIQKLRNKPKQTRDNVALGVAGSVSAIVLLGWLYIVPDRIGTMTDGAAQEQGTFSVLFDQIKEQTANIIGSIPKKEDLKTAFELDEQAASTTAPNSAEESSLSAQSTSSAAFTSTTSSTSATSSRAIRIATTSPTETQ